MAIIGIYSAKHQSNEFKMYDDKCEALTACEITETKTVGWGKNRHEETIVLFQCDGEKGTCSGTYLGRTLSCSGTKVELPEPED